MKIIIFYKHNLSLPAITYELEHAEFTRLASDFEQFLNTGSPKTGMYRRITGEISSGVRETKEMFIKFDEIAAIG
jgi:hypothetical protein